MSEIKAKGRRKFGKRDVIVVLFVVIIIVILSLGTQERRTAATPDNDIHRAVASRAACISCHGSGGQRPQPPGHTKADQCFQCHLQPSTWKGGES
ncbi:MAG: hypothetical protein ACE5DY_00090 [Mariprofundaceae bacterium]